MDLNPRPADYKPIPARQPAYFLAFSALSARNQQVSGGLISIAFFRSFSRVGRVVGRRKKRRKGGSKFGTQETRKENAVRSSLFVRCSRVEFEDRLWVPFYLFWK